MDELSPVFAHAKTIFDLPTPALILDRSRLERNAFRMLERVRRLGVTLRPHVKTSKSIDVLKLLSGGADLPITVSTLAEARYFFARGVRDILYAVGIAPVKLPQVAQLMRAGCTVRVILDSLDAAEAVRAFGCSEGLAIEALIEVDTDGHRAGIAPDDELLIEVARRLTSGPGARLAGVMTHAGGSYSARALGEFEEIAERERAGATRAADRLRSARFPAEIVSVGSTPTVHYARTLEGVTEARVGVYAFGDLVQTELGTCAMGDIAISVLTSVIGQSRTHGRVLTDAGFLALSRDRGTADFPVDWGYGAVCDAQSGGLIESVRVDSTNQEHGIITARTGELDWSCFPIGSRVRILPNHACATAAAYGHYFVTDGDEQIIGVWERVNGW
ncbi:MAG TPA: alanine racemase [Sphingomicrobium sp.]|jgi:D-serine deaminase-like pyridoxal phosphate-dependent protein|nr:alanine racemase [Sphingomicrobium sp.]